MPIPSKYRKQINSDPYFERCILCGKFGVQIHHVFLYVGRKIEEMWNYQPLCVEHHDECTPHKNTYKKKTRYLVEMISLLMMDDSDREKYYKKDWEQAKREALFELNQ